MNRTQTVLIGLLALQLVLIALVRSPWSDASTGSVTARPLLTGLDRDAVTRIELSREGKTVQLERGDDGWAVVEAAGFPADARKIDELLADLEAIEVRRPVVSGDRYHRALKVAADDNEARVRLFDAKGVETDLIVGSASNYRTTNVRLADEDPVYEIQNMAAYDVRADTAAWIEQRLVDVPVDRVVALTVVNAAGRFELARADGTWSFVAPPSTDAPSGAAVDALVRAVSGARLADAAGLVDPAAQGLDRPAATVTLRWDGDEDGAPGGETTVRIGGLVPGQDTQRYITRGGLNYAGTIWKGSIAPIVDATLESLQGQVAETAG